MRQLYPRLGVITIMSLFVANFLKYFATTEFTLRDSFQFAEEIVQFYSVGLNCIMKIALARYASLNSHKPLEFVVLDCVFMFNGKLYMQADGRSMGSPIAPVFASAF